MSGMMHGAVPGLPESASESRGELQVWWDVCDLEAVSCAGTLGEITASIDGKQWRGGFVVLGE